MRIGTGYDIHRLVLGRKLILAGVEFPGALGLLGHSDADAIMHAVGDAVLGAAALGDLGDHFPDDSERWKDADSSTILRACLEMALSERELVPVNVDVSVVAETPRIAPHKEEMRRNLASILQLPDENVSVKARTKEGIGAVGEKKAIEVHAVVLMTKTTERE